MSISLRNADIENPFFLWWLFLVPLSYLSLVAFFRYIDVWSFRTWKGSRASDIMAFEIVAFSCVVYIAAAGIVVSYNLFGISEYEKLEANPFYGRSEYVENHLVCYHYHYFITLSHFWYP